MIKKMITLSAVALATTGATFADLDHDQFCPASQFGVNVLDNCRDIQSCKSSCEMLTNIAMSSDDPQTREFFENHDLIQQCREINADNVVMVKAWANAFKETLIYYRKVEDC
jgi:hypothetical protein